MNLVLRIGPIWRVDTPSDRSAYRAEYCALYTTKGLRPMAVDIPLERETQTDQFCMTMIEKARQKRHPAYLLGFEYPERIASLLLEGRVVESKA